MTDTSELRKRVRAEIRRAQQVAEERRRQVADATRDGQTLLRRVVAPLFRNLAGVLRAEGHPFRVDTPSDAVRLVAEGAGENFVELALDPAVDPPQLLLRVSRSRGRRVRLDEKVACEHPQIGGLTEDGVLDLVVPELGPFLI